MTHDQIPDFIQAAGIADAPIDFEWRGPQAHVGPVETVNKLFTLVGHKTTCGMLTQAAGIMGWGAWRLARHTDVGVLLKLIEASFAFQVHPLHVDVNALPVRRPKDTPAAESAAAKLLLLLWRGMDAKAYWKSYYQPLDCAFHSAYIVRHIMPKARKRDFGDWLNGMLLRMGTIAPKPNEPPIEDTGSLAVEEREAYFSRHWGNPLPPEVLDPDFEYRETERVELVNRFLRRLDWRQNPFLRSPEQMTRLGFVGRPYRVEV